jgi:hypothetical protein
VTSDAATVEEYLAGLPEDRRAAIAAMRQVILSNLPEGYEESMQGGMIGYAVPHSLYPKGYHANPRQPLPFVSLANQKNHMALYLMCVYGDESTEQWFREEWARSGKKLDMGKSCVRFKRLHDVSLEAIGGVIARTPVADYVSRYEKAMAAPSSRRRAPGQ